MLAIFLTNTSFTNQNGIGKNISLQDFIDKCENILKSIDKIPSKVGLYYFHNEKSPIP